MRRAAYPLGWLVIGALMCRAIAGSSLQSFSRWTGDAMPVLPEHLQMKNPHLHGFLGLLIFTKLNLGVVIRVVIRSAGGANIKD